MTPNELQTLRFLCEALLWGLALVLVVVLPWAASGARLKIPHTVIARWAPRRGWDRGNGRGGTKGRVPAPKSKTRQVKKARTGTTASAPVAPAFVWDQDAIDAVSACQSLGFRGKEARVVVEELRGKEPGADCARLAKMAIGRLGRL